jgi:hypothetical protein
LAAKLEARVAAQLKGLSQADAVYNVIAVGATAAAS